MPHAENITSPMTIIGNGRSGTSLVSRVIANHPNVQFAGETANLIHSVWKSLESSLIPKKQPEIPAVIRQHFLGLFPGKSPNWLHKPIGIPIVWSLFENENDFCDWYWEVLPAVFPDARYFTVLRHPMDVIMSSHSWWGWTVESIINSNRLVARLLTHPKSRVDFAVDYLAFVSEPEQQTKRLLEYLELDFDKACLKAFESSHVVNDDSLQACRSRGFSHRDRWSDIPSQLLTDEFKQTVDAGWQKFGFDFGGWPN